MKKLEKELKYKKEIEAVNWLVTERIPVRKYEDWK